MTKKEQIRKIAHAQPFQPLNITMASGRTFAVLHPDFLAFAGKEDPFVYVVADGVMFALAEDQIVSVDTPARHA